MSVELLIMNIDGAAYKKGEIVSIQESDRGFGKRIKDNQKFRTIKISDAAMEDLEFITDPKKREFPDFEHKPYLSSRKYRVDIDSLKNVVTMAQLNASVIEKTFITDTQKEEVVV